MRIRRLGWAGVEIEADGASAVVDLMTTVGPLAEYVGEARGPLLEPGGPVVAAAVTHLHRDHTDPDALAAALTPDGIVLRPAPATGGRLEVAALSDAEQGLADHDLTTRVLAPWESHDAGPFRFTAVPSVDGFGDPQVAWVVEAEGRRVLHAGDTVFHGSWWLIAMRCGPIDVALLPANGPVVSLPHRRPASPYPAAMTPEEAATAASLLRARVAVPVHYDTLHQAPVYVQTDDPAARFEAAARAADVEPRVLETGEVLDLS